MSTGSLTGGSVRILWDASDSAIVTITGPSGAASTSFTVGGGAVTFPYTLSSSTTFETAHSGVYTVSVEHHGYEVANTPDGTRQARLEYGQGVTFSPTPDGTPNSQFISEIAASFVAQPSGMTVDTDDVTALVRLDNTTPVNKRVLQIRQDAAQYSVKIDHYGTDGHAVDITSHTTSATDVDYTVLGVTGYNIDFGTVKFVNNAAQTGGAVVAAWGTDAARTAPIYVADNWGQGDGFQSVHRAGSSAIAFRVSHDGASTFTDPAIWLPVRNVSNDVILLENAVAQTSGSLMYLNQQHASSTTPLIRMAQAGSGYLIDATADGFAVDGSGQVRTSQVFNITSFSNSRVVLGTTGTQIDRNVADSGAALKVQQTHASSTGDVLQVLTSGATLRSRFDKTGYFMTRLNAAPADGDLVAGEMALWFDSTNGASKLMVKAKQADGTVKTASVALA